MRDSIQIDSGDLIRWMDVIRSTQGREQYRVLESFWASQIRSKAWMVNILARHFGHRMWDNIFVFGGWYGVAGTMLKRSFPDAHVVSVDIDPMCSEIGQRMNPDVEFVTQDMARFQDYLDAENFMVINTSTEHVSDQTFRDWHSLVPKSRDMNRHLMVLQGNNFNTIPEHIRCATSIPHFKEINYVGKRCIYASSLNCVQFTRYMSMEWV